MKGKKNLERAIVLGLILSAGVYGSAWAADEIILDPDGNLHDSKIGAIDGGITIGHNSGIAAKDYIVSYLGANDPDLITVGGKGIYLYNTSTSKQANLNFSVKNLTINVDKLGAKTVEPIRAAGISSFGPNLKGTYEVGGNLEINYTFSTDAIVGTCAGIYAENQKNDGNAEIDVTAKNVEINGFTRGIFAGAKSNITLNTMTDNENNGDINITYTKTYEVNGKPQSAYGIEQYFNKGSGGSSKIYLDAANGINIKGVNKGIYIHAQKEDGITESIVNLKAKNDIYFEAMNVDKDPSAKSAELFGIHIFPNSGGKSDVDIVSNSGSITFKNFDRGIDASEGNVNLLAENGSIRINSLTKAEDHKSEYGIWADGILNKNKKSYVELTAGEKSTAEEIKGIVITGYAIGVRSSENAETYLHGDTTIVSKDKGYFVDNYPNSYKFKTDIALIANDNGIINVSSDKKNKFDFGANNYIDGNIIAVSGGNINIGGAYEAETMSLSKVSNSTNVIGNITAYNTGNINIYLGKNGKLTGRIDDYQDANLKDDVEFFNPTYWEGIDSSGTVNLDLGEGSTWDVTGQSWVSTLSGNGTVILVGEDTENGTLDGTGGYAVHIGTLSGNNTFVVNLMPDNLANSDMIYIQNGTADTQKLVVNNERDLIDNADWERIRFATVADAEESFEYGGAFGDTYSVKGRGVRNVDYNVEYVAMDDDSTSEDDNLAYNGGKEFDESDAKPGTDYTEEVYNKTDEGKNSQHVYLVRSSSSDNPGGEVTDSGKTIINMSRANYKNAIYMDRLNKRLGEARYINGEEDEGMWVRLRHDRIGHSGEFRSMNTMYELGYDKKQECDNGTRRVGMAIDYMRGSTSYSDIIGKGETKRYGLWLYDTWLGDKGHYADYVLKWGHLSNDFDIRDKNSLEDITGDYSNNVFSVSAEYGKKNDMGNSWYFEPQAQLQLARVTGADYITTTQNTKVSVDGINSLIGRAGFRLGKDFGTEKQSTFYIKADLLHEFLGDQTITATDATGTLREEYENRGTWYDVGLGFVAQLSKTSYAFLDLERSFGNDNDETYQINVGMQWSF
jgi:outer membrane autotransporter protein